MIELSTQVQNKKCVFMWKEIENLVMYLYACRINLFGFVEVANILQYVDNIWGILGSLPGTWPNLVAETGNKGHFMSLGVSASHLSFLFSI